MSAAPPTSTRRAKFDPFGASATGYSLVEVMVSVVIVGGLFCAAIQTLGASRVTAKRTTDRARAHMLAQGLIDEVLDQPYAEPGGSFGLDSDESTGDGRTAFDDVDDYDGWSASPPTTRDGTALDVDAAWSRRVTVHYADPSKPMTSMNHDTGLKRVHVKVLHRKKQLVELIALRGDTPGTILDPETLDP